MPVMPVLPPPEVDGEAVAILVHEGDAQQEEVEHQYIRKLLNKPLQRPKVGMAPRQKRKLAQQLAELPAAASEAEMDAALPPWEVAEAVSHLLNASKNYRKPVSEFSKSIVKKAREVHGADWLRHMDKANALLMSNRASFSIMFGRMNIVEAVDIIRARTKKATSGTASEADCESFSSIGQQSHSC